MGGSCAVNGALLFPRRCVCVALCLGVSFGSCCRCWLRVVLMCFQLMQLSCMVSGDLALWRGIWRRPVPSSRAGGDGWCFMRAVGCLGASFVWVGTGEPLMLAYMHQSTWVGKVEGGLGACELQAHEEGGEAGEGGRRGTGSGAWAVRHVGEHVVVRAQQGDGPLFVVVVEFLTSNFGGFSAR